MLNFEDLLYKAGVASRAYKDIIGSLSNKSKYFDSELNNIVNKNVESFVTDSTFFLYNVIDTVNEASKLLVDALEEVSVKDKKTEIHKYANNNVVEQKNFDLDVVSLDDKVLEKENVVNEVQKDNNDLENKVYDTPSSKLTEKPSFFVHPKTYTQYVSNIERVYSGNIKEAASILSGKSYVSNFEQRKNWKWSDRINNLEELLKNKGELEKEGVLDIQKALSKNKYLRYKKKDEYARLQDLLRCYVS